MNSINISKMDDISQYLNSIQDVYDPVEQYDIIYAELFHLLLQIYKKKEINEYYLKQRILHYFNIENDEYDYDDYDESEIYNKLANTPQIEQRSQAWYDQRYNMLTASELAVVFKKSPYCSQKQYIINKVIPKPRTENSFCNHGIKYEDIATYIYETRNSCSVNTTFGCLPHPTISFLGASPDGIVSDGTMIEIKCVVRREIIGIPPIYYWYQMQLQLEVANLNCCHFIECKIDEYDTYEEFLADSEDDNVFRSLSGMEKGMIFEYYDTKEKKNKFIYNNDNADVDKWKDQMIEMVIGNEDYQYVTVSYWYLSKYSCIEVYRNKKWFNDNLPAIEEFWNRVLFHRANGVDDLIKSKRVVNKKKPEVCNIE